MSTLSRFLTPYGRAQAVFRQSLAALPQYPGFFEDTDQVDGCRTQPHGKIGHRPVTGDPGFVDRLAAARKVHVMAHRLTNSGSSTDAIGIEFDQKRLRRELAQPDTRPESMLMAIAFRLHRFEGDFGPVPIQLPATIHDPASPGAVIGRPLPLPPPRAIFRQSQRGQADARCPSVMQLRSIKRKTADSNGDGTSILLYSLKLMNAKLHRLLNWFIIISLSHFSN